MAIKSSGAFNSPEMAQVAQNIAQMFGPPSAQDASAYSAAALNRQKKAQIEDLYNNPNQPDFDKRNIAIGNYAPTSSFEALSQNNATQRYGYDKSAETQRANNFDDNQMKMVIDRFGTDDPTHSAPVLPGDIAGMWDLPELPARAGTPAPLSETQAKGQALMQLPTEELLSIATAQAAPNGYRYQGGGSGDLEFIPGGPADPATAGKTTEATRRNQQLASVIAPELDSLLGDGTAENPGTFDALANGVDQVAGMVPGGNMLTSEAYQQATNSLTTIVASYLYSVSGATANPGEVENQVRVLTPRPGDDEATLTDKRMRLSRMVQAVQAAATGLPQEIEAQPAPAPVAPPVAPQPAPGEVIDGYEFIGGDPSSPTNWRPTGGQ